MMSVIATHQKEWKVSTDREVSRELRAEIERFNRVKDKLRKIEQVSHTAYYDLPDLRFPRGIGQGLIVHDAKGIASYERSVCFEENKEDYEKRQDQCLKVMVENTLLFKKGAHKRSIVVHKGMMRFMGPIFFHRTNRAIIWGPRGGGKSLGIAVLIWLMMIYDSKSFLDLAGSQDQAMAVYDYVKSFWGSVPKIESELLLHSLRTNTELKNGVRLKCVHPDVPVLTQRGFIPIKDVQVGDLALNRLGEFRPVLDVINRSYEGKLKVIQSGKNNILKITPEHQIWTRQVRHYHYYPDGPKFVDDIKNPKWLRADQVNKNYALLQPKKSLEVTYIQTSQTIALEEDGDRWLTIEKAYEEDYSGDVYDLVMDGDPSFYAGSGIIHNCVPSSEKSVRGKHESCLVLDESCQTGDDGNNTVMHAALQGPLSEPDSLIVLTSTFHWPIGFFAEHWDFAEAKGFTRFKFDVYDTMEKCEIGLTDDDGNKLSPGHPKAVEVCKQCPLTDRIVHQDSRGRLIGERWKGCFNEELGFGKARFADGWQTYDAISSAKALNAGSDIFRIEWECERPEVGGIIYQPDQEIGSKTDSFSFYNDEPLTFGIDWGYHGQCAILVGARGVDAVGIIDGVFLRHASGDKILEKLLDFEEKWGFDPRTSYVYADSSHPYENVMLLEKGFDVHAVDFGKYKGAGIANVQQYFGSKRIKIMRTLITLFTQLIGLRRDNKDRIVKEDDHGPDALLCLMFNYWYDEVFGSPSTSPVQVEHEKEIFYF